MICRQWFCMHKESYWLTWLVKSVGPMQQLQKTAATRRLINNPKFFQLQQRINIIKWYREKGIAKKNRKLEKINSILAKLIEDIATKERCYRRLMSPLWCNRKCQQIKTLCYLCSRQNHIQAQFKMALKMIAWALETQIPWEIELTCTQVVRFIKQLKLGRCAMSKDISVDWNEWFYTCKFVGLCWLLISKCNYWLCTDCVLHAWLTDWHQLNDVLADPGIVSIMML